MKQLFRDTNEQTKESAPRQEKENRGRHSRRFSFGKGRKKQDVCEQKTRNGDMRRHIALLPLCEERNRQQREETGAEKTCCCQSTERAKRYMEHSKENRESKKTNKRGYVSAVATSRTRVRVSIQISVHLIVQSESVVPHLPTCSLSSLCRFFHHIRIATDPIHVANDKSKNRRTAKTNWRENGYCTDRAGNGSMSLAWTCQTLSGSSPRTRYVFVPRRWTTKNGPSNSLPPLPIAPCWRRKTGSSGR